MRGAPERARAEQRPSITPANLALTTDLNEAVIEAWQDVGMDALSIASSGLVAASDRFNASAARLASGAGDLVSELTEEASAKAAFAASAAVARTSTDLSKQLLDILA